MYASIRTSPLTQSWTTHGTRPRSSKDELRVDWLEAGVLIRGIVGGASVGRRLRRRCASYCGDASVLERKLIVVTGKGGVGKTTMSRAIGLLAARTRGCETIVVELSGVGSDGAAAGRFGALLGHSAPPAHGVEVELGERLWGLSIDRDRVLSEWLRALGGRVPARVLTSSSSFQYLTRRRSRRPRDAAAWSRSGSSPGGPAPPGAPPPGGARAEVRRTAPAAMTWWYSTHPRQDTHSRFCAPRRCSRRSPASGPIARQARQVRELLEDPARLGLSGGGARHRDGDLRGPGAAGGHACASWAASWTRFSSTARCHVDSSAASSA